jgi:hypothetical protein
VYREESVPERLQPGKPGHEPYEALCALAAGGLLEGVEFVDFQAHIKECNECRVDYQELSTLVARELPQARGTFRQKLAEMKAKPLPDSRQRFLRRSRAEGVVFSPEVDALARSGPWYFRRVTMLAPVAVVVVVALSLTVYHRRETTEAARAKSTVAAPQQIAELERQNAELTASLSQLNQSLSAEHRELQTLRAQLASAATSTTNLRRNSEQSSSQSAQLLDEAHNQEKLLAEARDEAARISQLRNSDDASMVEQQARITELTNKLRVASATLDMERRLAASGSDVRELMAARQLHVIDVRDTDPNGNPSKAFGRVFLAEGKSLTFYAFDLDESANAKRQFHVWAALQTGTNSARSLGFLRVDSNAPGRWVLRVENPELVKELSSVFVTIEPTSGGNQPSGEKMLYAYLGEANHP